MEKCLRQKLDMVVQNELTGCLYSVEVDVVVDEDTYLVKSFATHYFPRSEKEHDDLSDFKS